MKPTLIRALDPELYRRFKAAAVLKGITLSQAFNEAMKLWLDAFSNKDVKTVEDVDNEFFEDVKAEIDRKYGGKYVLISNRRIVAVVGSIREAYEVISKQSLRRCIVYKAGESLERGEWLWGILEP
jgi:hypothetical protein